MMNVQTDACNRSVSGDFSPAGPELVQPGVVSGAGGSVAYLVPWGSASAVRFLTNALREGLAVKSSDKAFTHEGNRYPSGTLILDVADNPDDLPRIVRELATRTRASAVALDTSWVTDGPNFGSANVVVFNEPKVAIAWDRPTNPYSAGNTRFIIERRFDFPVTPIRARRLASSDLRRYQVVILPETGGGQDYLGVIGEDGIANLKDWVRKGGVLIGLGNANRFLADANVDLLSIRRENVVVEEGSESTDDNGGDTGEDEAKQATVRGRYLTSESEYEDSIAPEREDPDSVAGVLVNADVDPDHWLGAGVRSTLRVLIRESDIYTPVRLDKGVNVARFRAADELLESGYIWEENRRQLAYKPFTVVQPSGQAFVIAFTQDPNVRAYLDGLNVILYELDLPGSSARPACTLMLPGVSVASEDVRFL